MDFEDKLNALREFNEKSEKNPVKKKELIKEISKTCFNYGDYNYWSCVGSEVYYIPVYIKIDDIVYGNVCRWGEDGGYLLSDWQGCYNLDDLTVSELERVVEEVFEYVKMKN